MTLMSLITKPKLIMNKSNFSKRTFFLRNHFDFFREEDQEEEVLIFEEDEEIPTPKFDCLGVLFFIILFILFGIVLVGFLFALAYFFGPIGLIAVMMSFFFAMIWIDLRHLQSDIHIRDWKKLPGVNFKISCFNLLIK